MDAGNSIDSSGWSAFAGVPDHFTANWMLRQERRESFWLGKEYFSTAVLICIITDSCRHQGSEPEGVRLFGAVGLMSLVVVTH